MGNLKHRMLLVVDPQVDFVTGTLKVDGAEAAMTALAEHLAEHGAEYDACVITADWHPANHMSFVENGGIWPRHCVAFSVGASIYPPVYDAALSNCRHVRVLTKGLASDHEEYSIFFNEASAKALHELLISKSIDTIDICGIAGDVCVSDTLLDGIKRYGGSLTFNVLMRFSPSIDGGQRLSQIANQNSL